jgi:hypothetical protein
MLKRVPTRQEFEQMAARGRLHKEDNTVIPTDSELDEVSVACTATLKMILHTFISSGGACRKPHTVSTCGIYNKPRSRPLSVSLTSTSGDSLLIEAGLKYNWD